MKTTRFLVHLLLSTVYPAALVAGVAGLFPSNVPVLPVLLGFYVTTGVLGVAFLDYSRRPAANAHGAAAPLPNRPEVRVTKAANTMPSWRCRPASA